MPPKKDDPATTANEGIPGFTAKETKMIAAAFIATTSTDKYDYDLFATLTGNTAGSLKKMWPPVKRKAMEAFPSFGAFLGGATITTGGEAAGELKAKAAPKAKANNGKKRKATSTEPEEEELGTNDLVPEPEEAKKKPAARGRKKKADGADVEGEAEKKPVAKRGRKKVKSEEVADDEMLEDADNEET